MNRTLRNGLAVAGMTGGLFFLGQATAGAAEGATSTNDVTASSSADGGSATGSSNATSDGGGNAAGADASLGSVTAGGDGGDGGDDNRGSSGDGGDGGDAKSLNTQVNAAVVEDNDTAVGGNTSANGGTSDVDVNAGNNNSVDVTSKDEGDAEGSQEITNEVNVASSANGGTVHGSSNASTGGGGNSADASARLNSETTGGDGGDGGDDNRGNSGDGGDGGDGKSFNLQDNLALVGDNDTALGGNTSANGGTSDVTVNAGNNNTLTCKSDEGDVNCSQIITNIINIISQANGGTISCSSNASTDGSIRCVMPHDDKDGHKHDDNKGHHHHDADCPDDHGKPAHVAPAAHKAAVSPAKHMAPAAHKALSSAQPSKGQLASTGSDVSAPLTLGLLALGAGGALSLAGRRRQTTTV